MNDSQELIDEGDGLNDEFHDPSHNHTDLYFQERQIEYHDN